MPAAPRPPAEADGEAGTGDAVGRADRPSCVAAGRLSAIRSLPPLARYGPTAWVEDAKLSKLKGL